MARFSANVTDSSEDEDELYLTQPQETSKQPERSRAPSLPVEDEEDSDKEEASSSSSSSEMQEDELLTSPRRQKLSQTRNALIEDDDGEIRYAHEINKRQAPSKRSPPRQRGDPTIIPWAQQLGVDAQKMHVMQTSLFRMPEEAAAMKAMKHRPTTSAKRLLLPPQPMNRKHSRDSDGDGLRMHPREVRGSLCKDICISDSVIREPHLRMILNPCLIVHHGNMREWKVGHLL
jgi:nuclear pore complex protein Nup98-Nup96